MSNEEVLRGAKQLTPEERRRLRLELEVLEHQHDVNGGQSEQELGQAREERVRAVMDDFRELAERVGAAWKSDLSAVEAVREQRRDL